MRACQMGTEGCMKGMCRGPCDVTRSWELRAIRAEASVAELRKMLAAQSTKMLTYGDKLKTRALKAEAALDRSRSTIEARFVCVKLYDALNAERARLQSESVLLGAAVMHEKTRADAAEAKVQRAVDWLELSLECVEDEGLLDGEELELEREFIAELRLP